MDGEQCFATDGSQVSSLHEMQRRLEESERRNRELQSSLETVVARSREMLEVPLNRKAYQQELFKKFVAFVENRLRFHSALERICDECQSARRQTNVMTVGVGTVGFLASLQRYARAAGSVVSLGAAALNTILAVKGSFDEAARIKQLQKLEETDFKMAGQLINAYDEFCTLFQVAARVGSEDVMRCHMNEVVSSMVTFVDGVDSTYLMEVTGSTDPRTVIEYGLFNVVFPLCAKLGSSTLPDAFDSLPNAAGVTTVSLTYGESLSGLQLLASVVNGFLVLNALTDLIKGSESDAVRRMRFFIEQQKHELALFRSAINDANLTEESRDE